MPDPPVPQRAQLHPCEGGEGWQVCLALAVPLQGQVLRLALPLPLPPLPPLPQQDSQVPLPDPQITLQVGSTEQATDQHPCAVCSVPPQVVLQGLAHGPPGHAACGGRAPAASAWTQLVALGSWRWPPALATVAHMPQQEDIAARSGPCACWCPASISGKEQALTPSRLQVACACQGEVGKSCCCRAVSCGGGCGRQGWQGAQPQSKPQPQPQPQPQPCSQRIMTVKSCLRC